MTPNLARSHFLFGWAHDHPTSFKETEDPYQILNIFGIFTHIHQMLSFRNLFFLFESWCCVVSIATRLRAGQPGARIPVEERDFCVLQNAQTISGTCPSSYSLGTGILCPG